MLFTSGIFWYFYLLVVFTLFINSKTLKSIKLQNYTLLFASYFFYGYWDWRFLGLIFFVTLQTFICGNLINKFQLKKKLILFASLFLNLIILGYFKYANFFVNELLVFLNLKTNFLFDNVILNIHYPNH